MGADPNRPADRTPGPARDRTDRWGTTYLPGRRRPPGPFVMVLPAEGAVVDLLGAMRHRLGMEVAWLGRIDGDRQIVQVVDGDGESFGLRPGTAMHRERGYYARVINGELPSIIPDARTDLAARALPVTDEKSIGAYAAAPVYERDGALYGILGAMSHEPRPNLQRDGQFLRLLAEVFSDSVSDVRRVWEYRSAFWDRINEFIEAGGPEMVFQPIAEITHGRRIVGVEALSRFPNDPALTGESAEARQEDRAEGVPGPQCGRSQCGRSPCEHWEWGEAPERWFAEAAAVGLGRELELAAVRAALADLPRLPDPLFMSINVSPGTVGPELLELIRAAQPRRVVLEITEHERISEDTPIWQTIAELRELGVRIGADDVGMGYAGLAQLLVLRPELVKMDHFITHGVDSDPARRVIATALTKISDEIGACVLAEGIETEAELATLIATGVQLGQGNQIAQPSTLPLRLPPETPAAAAARPDSQDGAGGS